MNNDKRDGWTSDVLTYWFETLSPKFWFVKDAGADHDIRIRYLDLYENLFDRRKDVKATTPEDTLAAVLVLDQFPRNMFRDTPRAFASDAEALQLSKDSLAQKLDLKLTPCRRQFLYMPFQHSEDADDQTTSVELYTRLGLEDALDFARRHKQVVDQFGRFPHRNRILGRTSTAPEQVYLSKPGSGF